MNDLFELELTDIAHGGDALGRHEGRVIFVPYTIPGETVRVEVTEDKGRYAFARPVEVVEPSPDRVPPPCPYFGLDRCGGCQWQHIAYERQLQLKRNVLRDQLTRIGELEDPTVLPPISDETGWAYRNRAKFHPAPEGGLGFQSSTSDRIVPVEECLIIHPLLAEVYASLDLEMEKLQHLTLRAGVNTEEQMVIFETEDDLPPVLEADIPISCVMLLSDGAFANLIGSNHVTEIVKGHTYRVSAPSFFQVNTAQAATLVDQVLEFLELQGDEIVLDAYSGVGLFTTHVAKRVQKVIAIESAPAAVDDLLENTEEQVNVEVIQGPVKGVLEDLDVFFNTVIVDPPRGGVDRFALDAIVERRPNRIVYVSCDPATLARDIKRLAEKGYEFVKTQPIDMFPQTYHVESVSLLRRTEE